MSNMLDRRSLQELRDAAQIKKFWLEEARKICICGLGDYYVINDLHLVGCPALEEKPKE